MFNCNKNDLFNPPTPTPQNLCAAASLLLVGCHNDKNFKYKKPIFKKKSYIEVALYLSINSASS